MMDNEDYESWIASALGVVALLSCALGVVAWIEHQKGLKNTPEFENISFLPEDT